MVSRLRLEASGCLFDNWLPPAKPTPKPFKKPTAPRPPKKLRPKREAKIKPCQPSNVLTSRAVEALRGIRAWLGEEVDHPADLHHYPRHDPRSDRVGVAVETMAGGSAYCLERVQGHDPALVAQIEAEETQLKTRWEAVVLARELQECVEDLNRKAKANEMPSALRHRLCRVALSALHGLVRCELSAMGPHTLEVFSRAVKVDLQHLQRATVGEVTLKTAEAARVLQEVERESKQTRRKATVEEMRREIEA